MMTRSFSLYTIQDEFLSYFDIKTILSKIIKVNFFYIPTKTYFSSSNYCSTYLLKLKLIFLFFHKNAFEIYWTFSEKISNLFKISFRGLQLVRG